MPIGKQNVARSAAVRRRVEALNDRLESVAHADLESAIERLISAWHSAATYARLWTVADSGQDPALQHSERLDQAVLDSYAKAREELWNAYRYVRQASDAALRAMRALGHGRKMVVYRVELGVVALDAYMPINIQEVESERLSKGDERISQLQAALNDFVKWVDNWVEQNAPNVESLRLDGN